MKMCVTCHMIGPLLYELILGQSPSSTYDSLFLNISLIFEIDVLIQFSILLYVLCLECLHPPIPKAFFTQFKSSFWFQLKRHVTSAQFQNHNYM